MQVRRNRCSGVGAKVHEIVLLVASRVRSGGTYTSGYHERYVQVVHGKDSSSRGIFSLQQVSSTAHVKSDFSAKPMVLLLGQYSVGKTTFIKYFLKRDFPGIRIGPEPTTDKFVVIMDGPDERLIPGNTLAVQADKPFRPLAKFGNAFLNRFECAQVPCPLTKKITLVDSPGVRNNMFIFDNLLY